MADVECRRRRKSARLNHGTRKRPLIQSQTTIQPIPYVYPNDAPANIPRRATHPIPSHLVPRYASTTASASDRQVHYYYTRQLSYPPTIPPAAAVDAVAQLYICVHV